MISIVPKMICISSPWDEESMLSNKYTLTKTISKCIDEGLEGGKR